MQAGAGLLELTPVGMSLEDIFLELTTVDEAAEYEEEELIEEVENA